MLAVFGISNSGNNVQNEVWIKKDNSHVKIYLISTI